MSVLLGSISLPVINLALGGRYLSSIMESASPSPQDLLKAPIPSIQFSEDPFYARNSSSFKGVSGLGCPSEDSSLMHDELSEVKIPWILAIKDLLEAQQGKLGIH